MCSHVRGRRREGLVTDDSTSAKRTIVIINSPLPGSGSKFATSTFPGQSTQEREHRPRQLGFTGEAWVKVTVLSFSPASVLFDYVAMVQCTYPSLNTWLMYKSSQSNPWPRAITITYNHWVLVIGGYMYLYSRVYGNYQWAPLLMSILSKKQHFHDQRKRNFLATYVTHGQM